MMVGMRSDAIKSHISGYTSRSDPRTSSPFRLSIAASVAIAVPQMPMKWIRLTFGPWCSDNRTFLDHHPRVLVGDDSTADAERQRHRGTDRVARRETKQHGTWKIAEQRRHHVARPDVARRLVAFRQLADDDCRRSRQKTCLAQLRDHPVEPVRTLADFVEEEHVALRRIERKRGGERREELRQRASE